MKIGKCFTYRRTDQNHLVVRQRIGALHTLAEILSINIVHHKVLAVVTNYEVVGNTRQIRVA